jgi:hypothetical protein
MAVDTIAKFKILVRNGTDALVRPPFATAEFDTGAPAQQSVRIKNHTAAPALVMFPGNIFKAPGPGGALITAPFVIALKEKGAAGNSDVTTQEIFGSTTSTQTPGIFSFRVFCGQTQTFAQGNSDPEFIIEN